MLPPFLETLKKGPIVFDGATGSMLYERGVYLNKCFDELCLSNPQLVHDVHQDYVDVGVDVVETNSYGSNRIALAHHDLADKVVEICTAAVRIAREAAGQRAYVAGAVGPTGLLPKDLIRSSTRRKAFEALREQAQALVLAGADLLIFETFHYLGELEIALEASYGLDVPIVAEISFADSEQTRDGASPEEVVDRLSSLGASVIGANCVLGPERLLKLAERMVGRGLPVIMQPNAGFPQSVDGRAIYQSSPETFGVIARRAYKSGLSAVGGCCGTTPDHMRRVVAAARMLGGGRWRSAVPDIQVHDRPRGEEPVPLAERSAFGAKVAAGEFVTSVEMLPPSGLDPARTLTRIKQLEDAGVDVVNIPDGPRAMVRMSNIALARLVVEHTKIEPLLHFCGRDRNLLGLQGDLLGAHVLGVHNLVCVTGDPPKVGDYPDATAVFDLDSIGILQMASGLNRGVDPAGKPVGDRTRFVLATGVEPSASDFDREIRRLFEKRDAGAELVMTQPVFDPAVLERFLDPDDVRKRMAEAPEGGARDVGIHIAAEALRSLKALVQGAYLMPPFGRVESALAVLELAND